MEIEIKTLGNFIVILFKNIFEIMELNSFPNSHHKLYVRINMKELKILTSNMQRIIVKYDKISNALKMFSSLHRFRFRSQKKLVAFTRSHVT